MTGPLQGLRVVEIAALGPAPFCGMVLADLGADVVRVDRAGAVTGGHTSSTRNDLMGRGKRSIGVDLKHEEGVSVVLRLVEGADALIEGFRPGVTERLGIGPAVEDDDAGSGIALAAHRDPFAIHGLVVTRAVDLEGG